MFGLVAIPAFTFINRLRGGGFFKTPIGLVPMAALFSPLFLALAVPLVLAYSVGWFGYGAGDWRDPIATAELISGFFWGVAVAAASVLFGGV